MSRLRRPFFARDTVVVARQLLGKHLVRVLGGTRLVGRIVEVEAYVGEEDEACHASCGPTQRNASMYGPPGCAYVYFIYGMYHCFNVVSGHEGFPAAVLVRALRPLEGLEEMRFRREGRSDAELTNGPAKLCQALAIDRQLDGVDLCAAQAPLFIESGAQVPEDLIASTPRINVRGDEKALNVPWRFYVRGSRYLSR
jgi:DNA-3-methyladenine glycosylase